MGPAREEFPIADNPTAWAPNTSTDWDHWTNNSINYKHLDCDGDGAIGEDDVQAIIDNYRPDLVPPKPIRQNTGWLSSNMAQLMVFLNGLILTITAFATLNVFISEIIREELLETTSAVQEHFFTGMVLAPPKLAIVQYLCPFNVF